MPDCSLIWMRPEDIAVVRRFWCARFQAGSEDSSRCSSRMRDSLLKASTPLSALRVRVCRGESSVTHFRCVLLIFLGIFPLTARAQQANAEKPLNDVQKLGQRVF